MTSWPHEGRKESKKRLEELTNDSQLVYPVVDTEDHRCAVFTHNQQKRTEERLSVTTMSAATASIADAPRTNLTSRDDSSKRNRSGQPQAQCTPMPLPAQGTQKIIQGNGTNVGTVISLHCPPEFELVGSKLMCVMDTNSTHWVGETYCKPSSPYGDYGFRVAVLASIVSSAIIFLMSVAFITCCLLDCIEEDKRKSDNENESEMWQWEEQAQHQKDGRSRYSHKGRNNNNNNSQEKLMSQWGTCNPAMCDAMRACRCHQHYAAYGPPPPLSALPGFDYRLPLLPQNPESAQISGPPPQYFGPPQSQIQGPARPGLMWQYEGQWSHLSGVKPSSTEESNTRNINSAKDFPIRIISV